MIGAPIIGIGFLAASRVRHVCNRPLSAQVRLVLFSVLAGAAVGVVHMGTNLVLASLDADISAFRLTGRRGGSAPRSGWVCSSRRFSSHYRIFGGGLLQGRV